MNKTNTWIFEIYCQPIPSKLQLDVQKQLFELVKSEIKSEIDTNIETYCTTRRISTIIENLPSNLCKTIEKIKGPKIGIGEEILDKFISKIANEYNLTSDKIKENIVEQEGYYYINNFEITIPLELTLQNIMHKILFEFKWIRTMKWIPNSNFKWIRPIHNLLSILNEKIVPFKFEKRETNNITFTEEYKPVKINSAQTYKQEIESINVILDYEKRKQIILNNLENEKYDLDETLLQEIVCSTQNPHPFFCTDEETQLLMKQLPSLFVKTCVEEHQQAICIYDKDCKYITKFLLVSQKPATETMKTDCLTVIKYRLQDMLFMLEQDKITDLSVWEKQLHEMLIYKDLGTLANKCERMKTLIQTYMPYIINLPNASKLLKAIEIYKLDLCSQIVKEFPSLHSHLIALLSNDEKIQNIILTYNNSNIGNPLGLILGLVDRLDTLIAFFTLPLKINSSQDPLGLRKLATEIVQFGRLIPNIADLPDLINIIYKNNFEKNAPTELIEKIASFIKERQEYTLPNFKFKLNIIPTKDCLFVEKLNINSFWNNWEKSTELSNFTQLDYVKQIYKRLSNFIKNATFVEYTETEDIATNQIIKVIQTPIANTDQLLVLSQTLEHFFDNNMVLEPIFLNHRLGLLFKCQKIFDSYAIFG